MAAHRIRISTFIRAGSAMRWTAIKPWIAALLLSTAAFLPAPVRADTVASLLGNFTINQFSGLTLRQREVELHYVVVFGQLPALAQLHSADANHDGVTSQQERDDYVGQLAQTFLRSLDLRVDGAPVALRAAKWSSALPTETGGFSLRVDAYYRGELSAAPASPRNLEFTNDNFSGRIGWNEIVLTPAPGLTVFNTNAYANSLTAALADALTSLPPDGPLHERSVHAQWGSHVPAGAALLAARPGTAAASVGTLTKPDAAASIESAWIAKQTRALIDVISTPRLAPGIVALTLLGALLLGAVHALSPGHGKTIVGAYLIGSRGTPRHAVFLGLTVTITHTLGVFALGLITLYAAQFLAPEKLLPLMSVGSGLVVLGMGSIMLWQRIAAARKPNFIEVRPSLPGSGIYAQPTMSSAFGMHSHGGGPMHSHLPPGAAGDKVTWRSLLALGISGGLVPCPSAMVLLLAAVALNKTAFGMLLVTAFSVGLAITLTAVGLAFLWARSRLPQARLGSRWPQLLPVMSAAIITLLGLFLCVGAVQSFGAGN
jgi:nickel/cobalt exporter